eukprot:355993-Chlamydomonas_euryale.AAC.1
MGPQQRRAACIRRGDDGSSSGGRSSSISCFRDLGKSGCRADWVGHDARSCPRQHRGAGAGVRLHAAPLLATSWRADGVASVRAPHSVPRWTEPHSP